MPPRRERNGGPAATPRLAVAFEQSARDAAVLALELPQVREGGSEAELLTVAGVDAAHERLDEAFVRLAAHAARNEGGDRLVAGFRARRQGRTRGANRTSPAAERIPLEARASSRVGIMPVRPSGSGRSSAPSRT